MKSLIIVEHDNNSIKQSTFSTITAASKISDDCDALLLGNKIDKAIENLKKSSFLKKIYAIDNEKFEKPIAENLSEQIISFLKDLLLNQD